MTHVSRRSWKNTVRKPSAFVFAALALVQTATAEWQVISSDTAPTGVSGVEHRHFVVREAAGGADATLDLALFPAKSVMLRVIDNAGSTDSLAEAMTREKCIAGVNGGYFDTNFKPIGLRVINGATTSPKTRARLLTGVLSASSRGVEIGRVGEYSPRRKLEAAVECGPFLVDRGVRVANLDDKREARRTFAAVARGGMAALGVSSDLTLAQLGSALSDRSFANDFHVSRALNLDGGSSSAFWLRKKDGSTLSISEAKRVRDFVGIAPR